ncbi:hypothetical protein SDC9_143961 [bioreactor metagenome]|uniref:Uncharacterized protein n=1 Tax=bioreactor metagenome TaxID=1076179 RepID=A0A645E5K8_9ZZZZ
MANYFPLKSKGCPHLSGKSSIPSRTSSTVKSTMFVDILRNCSFTCTTSRKKRDFSSSRISSPAKLNRSKFGSTTNMVRRFFHAQNAFMRPSSREKKQASRPAMIFPYAKAAGCNTSAVRTMIAQMPTSTTGSLKILSHRSKH